MASTAAGQESVETWGARLRTFDATGTGAELCEVAAPISQLLVAFAVAYEARPIWPLSSTALVVVHLRGEPMPLDEVPGRHGITGDGKSLLERHGAAVDDLRAVLERHPAASDVTLPDHVTATLHRS